MTKLQKAQKNFNLKMDKKAKGPELYSLPKKLPGIYLPYKPMKTKSYLRVGKMKGAL